MRSMKLVWIGFVLMSCRTERVEPSNAPNGVTEAAAQPGVSTRDFVALLTAHPKPTLVGPFAALRLTPDLTIANARRMAPELVRHDNVMKALDWFEYKGTDYPGVSLRTERFGQLDCDPDNWLVGRLRAVVKDDHLKDKLTASWGPPAATGKRTIWLDPETRLRCVIEASNGSESPAGTTLVDCGGYLPTTELVGTDRRLFGFENGRPLLGMTHAAVQRRFGCRVFDDSSVMLWPTELELRSTAVTIGDGSETIEGFTIAIDVKTAKKLLEAKFGKPRIDEELGEVYRANPRVALSSYELTVGVPPE